MDRAHNNRDEWKKVMSKRLAFILRHAPVKYPDIGKKMYKGGFLHIADLLTHLRGHNEQDLLECIDWSVSSVKNEPRFEVKLSNGQIFVRATYGHSFVTDSGIDISNARDRTDATDKDNPNVPSLLNLALTYIASDLKEFPEVIELEDGYLINSILQKLKEIVGAKKISNKTLKMLISPHALTLDLSGLLLEDSTFKFVANTCTHLTALSLARCFTGATDTNLLFVVKRIQTLRKLDLSECKYITDKGLAHIAKFCPNLQYLSLRDVEECTDAAVLEIVNKCPNIRHLDLWACKKISLETLNKIKQSLPDARLFHELLAKNVQKLA
jgi:hypothetical protein